MANPIITTEPKKTINGFVSKWNAIALPVQYIISNDKYPTGATVTNYRTEIDIWVNGSLIASISQLPDSDNETRIDIRKYLQTVLKFIPSSGNIISSSVENDNNAWCTFYIEGREKYTDSGGVDQENTLDNTGNEFYGTLSSLQLGSSNGGNMYDYVLDSTKTDFAQWLTVLNSGDIVDNIESFIISTIVNDSPFNLVVKQFDINGVELQEDISSIPDLGIGLYRIPLNFLTIDIAVTRISILAQKSSVDISETYLVSTNLDCFDIVPVPPTIYDTASFAFGLFRMTTNPLSVRCFNVRRSSDNAITQVLLGDVGDYSFITLNNLVSAGGTLGDWVGSGTTNLDAFITSWFDQTDSGLSVDNNTLSQQPKIITAGAILLKNATPKIDFDGSNDKLEDSIIAADGYTPTDDFTLFTVSNNDSIETLGSVLEIVTTLSSSQNNRILVLRDSRAAKKASCVWYDQSSSSPKGSVDMSTFRPNTDQVLQSIINNGSLEQFSEWDNSEAGDQDVASGSTTTGSFIQTSMRVGVDASTTVDMNGGIQLLVGYKSDKTTELAAIQNEIITKLSIPTP